MDFIVLTLSTPGFNNQQRNLTPQFIINRKNYIEDEKK